MKPSWVPATTTWTASCTPSSTVAGARTDASAPAWTPRWSPGLAPRSRGWSSSARCRRSPRSACARRGSTTSTRGAAPARAASGDRVAGSSWSARPIGNLGDLTPRAAEALRTADLVVAEDTRLAARLLAHVGARTPTQSFNEHNGAGRLPGLLARLAGGRDAGADDRRGHARRLGSRRRAGGSRARGRCLGGGRARAGGGHGGHCPVRGGGARVPVRRLPAVPAGIRARQGALDRLLAAAASAELPLVLYEAPHRMAALLAALGERVPDCLGGRRSRAHQAPRGGAGRHASGGRIAPRQPSRRVHGGHQRPPTRPDVGRRSRRRGAARSRPRRGAIGSQPGRAAARHRPQPPRRVPSCRSPSVRVRQP